MSGLTLWFALLGGEVVLILLVLLFVAWLRANAMQRRDRKAVAKLIAAVRKAKGEREKAIEQFLSTRMGMEGGPLEAQKVKTLREEMRLLQRFADIYRNRDAGGASQFFVHLEAALDPYHELTGSGAAAAGDAAEGGADMAELEHLRQENARLSEELSVTMDTMSRMLSEYSTMFAGGEAIAQSADLVLPDEPALQEESEQAPGPLMDDPIIDELAIDQPAMDGRDSADLDSEELDIGEVLSDEASSGEVPLAGEDEHEALEISVEPTEEVAVDPEATMEIEALEDLGDLDELTDLEHEPKQGGEEAAADVVAQVADESTELDLGIEGLDALFDSDEDEEKPDKRQDDNSIAI